MFSSSNCNNNWSLNEIVNDDSKYLHYEINEMFISVKSTIRCNYSIILVNFLISIVNILF